MFIYKFRALANNDDLERGRNILITGRFWCSPYWELNDPMEGVYETSSDLNSINRIFDSKNKIKICSFSGSKGFKRARMWGYYANGFRGYVLKVIIKKEQIEKIKYVKILSNFDNISLDEIANKILTTKLSHWKTEDEYRFLTEIHGNEHKVGKIVGIYFGKPYANTINYSDIEGKEKLQEYDRMKLKLISVANAKNIPVYDVLMNGNKIFKK